MKSFSIVAAATASTLGIGKNGNLPWRLSGDLAFFKSLTMTSKRIGLKNVVIMGRKTYESLPSRSKPLPGRINIVLSRNPQVRNELTIPETVLVMDSLSSALIHLNCLDFRDLVDEVFVIGGGALYAEAIQYKTCSKIYLTLLETEIECDTFFPAISSLQYRMIRRSPVKTENIINYKFLEFESIPDDAEGTFDIRVMDGAEVVKEAGADILQGKENIESIANSASSSIGKECLADLSLPIKNQDDQPRNVEEMQYLMIAKEIIENGTLRGDRTGTGTLSKFGVQMRFSLRDGVFPLLTTKKVFWRGVVEELLWFVKGSTNSKELSSRGVHIWDANGSREFLDKCGLGHREEGDLGPVYGFQWRHFGAEYVDMNHDYTGSGVDQLMDCIRKIKDTPEDRRIIMSAWNPSDLSKMALPPCHMFCQFYVADGTLSCQMYQRSADMGLGVPFNIASYALLTVMMAQVCGLQPGEFVHTIGDAHVYLNHVDALKEQLLRQPKPFPRLIMNPAIDCIDGFALSDFTIEGYNPDASIKMKMAV